MTRKPEPRDSRGDWSRADDLLSRALDLEPEARADFIRARTKGDPDLEATVRSLLGLAEPADALLEGFQDRVVAPLATSLWEEGTDRDGGGLEGTEIDRYRIVRRLDRGGMGSVYVAERADAAYEQRVAIKVLRRGLDTEDVVRRFRLERQILASLAHPNIAGLLDGGTTPDGRPYLVMELVHGSPIDEYCDEHRLSVNERLRLFVDVGRAVQHAHNRLVVHRDLKPSNILVTPEQKVKLLDFGIAKLLDPRAYPGDPARTRTGLRLLTPEYASPEQRAGEPVTTASDVYQLGLLLYDLLCGREGREASGRTTGAAEGASTVAWRRPSTSVAETVARSRRTTPDRLRRRLKGDLDNIVLMALREEPDRRYSSALQLVEEVERHLAGHPVSARADSRVYRARKFLARHPVGTLASAAAILLVSGSAVALAIQARNLEVQRDRAVAEATRVEEAQRFLLSVFEASDPNVAGEATPSARDVLDAGAERLGQELSSQPELRAELLGTIGQIYISLGIYETGVATIERALRLHEEVGVASSAWARDLDRHAEILRSLAPSGIALDSPLVLRTRAVAMAEDVAGADSPLLAELLVGLAREKEMLERSGDPRFESLGPEVAEDLDRAIEILRGHPGDARRELANALNARALGHQDAPLKLVMLEEALELRQALYGTDHTDVAGTLNDLALSLEESDPVRSDSLMRQAAEIYGRVLGPEHAETLTILNNLAGLRRDRGEFRAAADLYERILEVRRRTYPELRGALAYTTYGLGVALLGLEDHEGAISLLRETIDLLAESPHLVHITRVSLGRALAGAGRYAEAERELLAAREWWMGQEDPSLTAETLRELVSLYELWGRPERAAVHRLELASASEGPEADPGR